MKTYIGYACNQDIRQKATSGGIGSALLMYLFDSKEIHTAVSFNFDEDTLQYVPILINSYNEYKITGSIYHEINMFSFIKSNITNIKEKIFLFLLPCQVKSITSLLDRNNIQYFIVSMTCSSQQNIDATFFLMKVLKVNRGEVRHIQYRGNGWPGGVTITLKNGEKKFVPNNNSIWTDIFHSRLFIQKRCFKCDETISKKADIILADPWLKEYIECDKIGQSIIGVNTEIGIDYINRAEQNSIIYKEDISNELVIESQLCTIRRKRSYIDNPIIMKYFTKLLYSRFYRKFTLTNSKTLRLNNKIISKIESLLQKTLKNPPSMKVDLKELL